MHVSGPIHAPTARRLCVALAGCVACIVPSAANGQIFTDTGSPANPPWSTLVKTLNQGSPDPGPVHGSVINVSNAFTEAGLFGNRPISVEAQRIHVCCNTSTTNFSSFTRWFQTDGNTQVFRLFVNDENTASSRTGAARSEAFTTSGWSYADHKTFEWTGRFTIARRPQGFCIFQVKNDANDWGLQLNMTGSGTLLINHRRNAADVVVTNADGSPKDFDGAGFDVRILDDGRNYKCWIDGVLWADNFYDRPTSTTDFRWGTYCGDNIINPPADYSLILVSGAQVKSWPGRLDAAVTTVTKANNAQNLGNTGSWSGGVVPGGNNIAVWNSTVTAANTTTLNVEQAWAGLRITNPGGLVTINGTSTLGLDASGVNMSTATRSLVVNCPVELRVTAPWQVAANQSATLHGAIRGYGGLTLSGSGTVILTAPNTFRGATVLNGGTLQLGNGATGGTLSIDSEITVNAGSVFAVHQSDAVTQGVHFSGTPLTGAGGLRKSGSGTLTLTAANVHSGPTTVNEGTLAFSSPTPFSDTSDLALAGGTLLQPTVGGATITAPIAVGSPGTTAAISAPTNLPGAGVVSTLTLGGAISGAGNVAFTSSANQNALSTVLLSAPCTYAGTTLLNTNGTTATQIILKLGAPNALPVSTVVTIDGQAGEGSGRYAEINLNGFSQQLAGLTNTPRSLRVQRIVNSDAATAAVLTIQNSSTFTYSGNLGGSAVGSVSASSTTGSTNGNNFSLVKSGAGTFTVSGPTTYSGDTTVHQGILSLGSANANNQASKVSIASAGATLNLAFSGSDTVGKLFIGGNQLAAGIYEAVGNPGPGIELAQITGTGTLTVTNGPPIAYAAWQNANGTSQSFDQDHDGDSVKNGVEYFLGGANGNTTGFTAVPAVTHAAGAYSVTWTKSADYTGAYGSEFMVESASEPAGPWSFEPLGGAVMINANDVKYTFPTGLPRKYVRLRVIEP